MKFGILASTAILLTTAIVPNAMAFSLANGSYSEDGITVDIKQIKELAENDLFSQTSTPSQALAETIASMVSKDPSGDNGNFTEVLHAHDVLHYFYPKATEKELEGVGITPTQAVQWLNLKGYTAKIIDRALTTEEIKARLDNSEPIVTVLENQNKASWLNEHYAGVLYAHDDVETGSAEGKLHASFIKSVNYGEAIVNDGEESTAFQFSEMSNSPDPIQAESTFKWVSTITEIKRDPSWSNSQTIKGDRAKGVFEHKVTSDGTQSQVDFTDPDVTALLNKYPIENKEHVMKLAAVSLINLYEDQEHQKTVKDLEEFLKISSNTYVSTQNIIDWYKYLGFDFDVVNGRAPMSLTKALNDSGRLYLTMFKAQDTTNPVKNTAAIGAGYLNNSFNGYSPQWYTVKLGENTVPFYNVPLTPEGMKQQQELAKTFKYTNVKRVVSDPFSKTDYEEEKTIYNIRLKGLPDESGIELPPSESVETPPEESAIKPVASAHYIEADFFTIRETQGQVPWCSSFVNAAAVNTVYQAPLDESDDKGAITTAKKLMQLDRPGVPDEELENLPGTTIQNALDILKKNYKVTADFEQRVLSFEEVKKEIDAGGIIQMDGKPEEASENGGEGHAVSIVGYVMPKEGEQAPYYIVWNPWWNTTFYLSSQAKTFNLGGMKYEWYRTWHNWRKVDGVNSVQTLDPELGNQKVLQGTSSNSLKEPNNLFSGNLVPTFNKVSSDLEQGKNSLVAQFGSPVMWRGSFGAYYGYDSTASVQGKRRVMRIQSYNTLEAKLYYDTPEAEVWRKDVESMNEYQRDLRKSGIALAYEIPLMLITGGVVKAGLVGASAIKKIAGYSVTILAGLNIIGDNNPIAIATTLYNYYNLEGKMIEDAERCYFADGPL